ncbi:MAG: Gar1/Naf1 family protein [Methanobacterium sp.]|nr:Gar1/Naf1 family protein [Methanobacterium sp.]
MKQLGKISHISHRNRVILKSDQTPGFGLPVFTKDNKKFGTIYDVFGPTKGQYISVKVFVKNSKNLEKQVGETLYISSKKVDKRGGRKRRTTYQK